MNPLRGFSEGLYKALPGNAAPDNPEQAAEETYPRQIA
jgi:hypothetical protein